MITTFSSEKSQRVLRRSLCCKIVAELHYFLGSNFSSFFFFFKWKNKCAVLLFSILYNQHNYNPHFWKNVAFHSALIRSAFGGCYLSCFVAVIIVFNILLSHQKKQTAITSHRHNTTMQRSSRAASSVDYHFDCSIIWIYLYLFHSQSSPTQINTKAFPMFNP